MNTFHDTDRPFQEAILDRIGRIILGCCPVSSPAGTMRVEKTFVTYTKFFVVSQTVKEQWMSEEDYLRHELQSEVRHEYLDGKLLVMSGESLLNNTIALRFASLLLQRLSATKYSVFMEGVKVKIPNEPKYFYPDILVSAEPLSHPIFVVQQPELIAEVLSESTRKYDTIDKFIQYQKFDSLKYYLLIEPAITLVSLFIRTGADWELSTFTGINDMIDLPAIGVSFNLSEIYK